MTDKILSFYLDYGYTHFRAYQKSQECVFVYEASRINMSSSPAMPGLLVSSLLHWEY